MNKPIDALRMDQLVDGELSDAEVRDLLAALSDEPDGWKRCALAFVEDQMLRGDLALLAQEQRQFLPAAARPLRRAAPRWTEVAAWALAMAACFAVAFLTGRHWNQPPRDERGAAPSMAASHPQRGASLAGAGQAPTRSVTWPADDSPLGRVTLVVNDQDQQPYQLPFYPLNSTTSQWLVSDQSSIPADVLEAFESAGSTVHRDQYWAPLELEDGRRLVIPIEQVEIVPGEPTWSVY
jgi:hypothetical protein